MSTTATKTEPEVLHFYYEGEGFTNLLRAFIKEGCFHKVYTILEDGGLPLNMIRLFFENRAHFEGTTKNGGDLEFVSSNIENSGLDKELYWALVNCFSSNKEYYIRDTDRGIVLNDVFFEENKDIIAFKKVFGSDSDSIIDSFKKKEKLTYLQNEGFTINPSELEIQYDGSILRDGTFIGCGYQEHNYLYPILYGLGLSTDDCWTKCESTLHVSSRTISGHLASRMRHAYLYDKDEHVSFNQIETLFKYRDSIVGVYSERKSIVLEIMNFISDNIDFGGKYNNLYFLSKFYPDIKLPRFSKEDLCMPNQCIRTSPKYSIAGLLNSKFNINENSIAEIEADFEKYKDVVKNNELHYFYQEFIKGFNGVCHYMGEGTFKLQVSENQGDVVNGVKSNVNIHSFDAERKLRDIAKRLYKDIKKPIQLEFVVDDNEELYIVQLRLLKNTFDNTVIHAVPEKFVFTGRTFSYGSVECSKEEVLVVDEDAKSSDLIGKKALIVKQDMEFSHILALSQALGIPSIFSVVDFVELPDRVKITALNEQAYVEELK